ncbi:MAG TPA: hypothetical protein VG964_02335 [Candidatus Saccharimonadales bacterium]|nr:hypothetical protein [Candidatus Saccharimonadales bacterium]
MLDMVQGYTCSWSGLGVSALYVRFCTSWLAYNGNTWMMAASFIVPGIDLRKFSKEIIRMKKHLGTIAVILVVASIVVPLFAMFIYDRVTAH